jgi:membrane protein implicated in regulation of membrane protease activity
MLIVALVMAVIGLAALVTAVVTSNEVIAWVCIAASVIGVVLLIVDAVRERQRRDATPSGEAEPTQPATRPAEEPEAREGEFDEEYPEDTPAEGGSADR